MLYNQVGTCASVLHTKYNLIHIQGLTKISLAEWEDYIFCLCPLPTFDWCLVTPLKVCFQYGFYLTIGVINLSGGQCNCISMLFEIDFDDE